jgi:hypothetical protein
MERKFNYRTAQTSSGRKGTGTDPAAGGAGGNLNATAWFEPSLALYMGGSGPEAGAGAGAGGGGDFDIAGQFPDESGVLGSSFGFNGWEDNLPLSPPATATSLSNALAAAPSVPDVAPSGTGTDNCNREDSEDVDDNKLNDATEDLALALSAQLVALSQRATRAVRRLVRPGGAPLTVSSPEINAVLEDTNTLIRAINNITAPHRERGDNDMTSNGDATTTNSALPFLALTCHQHLVALFHAICDAIYRCQKEQKEHYQQHQQQHQHQSQTQRSRQNSDIGPSSIAQFVMVLQLLMHLINRIDRSLFQNHPSMRHGSRPSTGNISPVTSSDLILSQTAAEGSSPHGGLLDLVQNIVRTIPDEHEKLRQVIQKLQTEIELWLGNG